MPILPERNCSSWPITLIRRRKKTSSLFSMNPEVKIGDKIRIVQMIDPYENYDGRVGVVEHIDSMGQLHGTWGGLALIPEEDEYIKLN